MSTLQISYCKKFQLFAPYGQVLASRGRSNYDPPTMIPAFNKRGYLPPGRHQVTWNEFAERFGWNHHRRTLLVGLKAAIIALSFAGCKKLYVDGSFVTAKEIPNDFDACYDVTGMNFGKLDPVLQTFDNQRALQKLKYQGELFPAQAGADSLGTLFVDFFQKDEIGVPKGIMVLDVNEAMHA